MIHTNPLATQLAVLGNQLAAILKFTGEHQLAVTIERRLLVKIAAYFRLVELVSATSPQPANEQKQPDNV